MAGEKRQTCWPKLHIETEFESQLTAIRSNRNINNANLGGKKKRNKRRIYGLRVHGRDLRHYTKQVKSTAGERFIHEAHSFIAVSLYTYLCMSVFTTSFG